MASVNSCVRLDHCVLITICSLEEKLEKWLVCPDMKQKQLETLELRHEGTGHWLLEGHRFIQWQDNPGLLWIRGPCNSAVISELVDDQRGLKDLANAHPPPAIAFFYFDFKNKQGQAVDSVLRRIILQLSAQSPNPYKTLAEHFKSKSNGQTLPTYQELQKILEELLLELGRTYIVLDALDECEERDQRRLVDFISTLRQRTPTPLHLLFTSQPRRIFIEAFVDVTCIELESALTQEDIRLFVDSELQRLEPWANRAADLVVSKSNGMFRMAACLIVEISHCPWEDELDKTLENLPNDLFEIYDRFLQAIRPEHRLYAEAALRWLMFSRWELTPNQLADGVAFDFSDPAHYTYKPSRREGNMVMIPRWLEGLATFTGRSVVLAHASVQDYLLSTLLTDKFGYNFSARLSHTFIARTCIGYFLHFANYPLEDEDGLPSDPLVQYAADNWCKHLLHSHDRTGLFGAAMRLLEDGTEPYKVLKRAVRHPHASPLHLCCEEGYIEGVRRLLECGANINLQSDLGNPLRVASWWGHTEIVCLLLENGADVSVKSGEDENVLQVTVRRGHIEIVRLLLQSGVDVNAIGGDHGSALQAASRQGHTEIMCLLLENGADVNTMGRKDGTALQAAARKGHTEIVHLLLEYGAQVNVTSGRYRPALQAASRYGHTEIVRLLLHSGADVNAIGEEDRSPLQAASQYGHTDIVRHLLENGADPNAMGGEDRSPLQTASLYGHKEIVCHLLNSGADVNAIGGAYGSALEAATRGGDIEIARLLLENGADVNTMDRYHGSVLQAAAGEGYIEIVCLLLENGADVNTGGGYSGSALQAASSEGHTEIVHLLLENGADVNTREGNDETALQAASLYGHTEIVFLLLENGADPNATGGKYGSALHAAAWMSHTEIVDLLLEKGAVDTRVEESDPEMESVEDSEDVGSAGINSLQRLG
ncbi:ankyrin repeat-containing domain protein [Mycena vulgaris]|nr:ankyrin repeat-containing domain protein [Mycena vulgaris]